MDARKALEVAPLVLLLGCTGASRAADPSSAPGTDCPAAPADYHLPYHHQGASCRSDADCPMCPYDEVVAVLCSDGACEGVTSIDPD